MDRMLATYEEIPEKIEEYREMLQSDREMYFWNATLELGVRVAKTQQEWARDLISDLKNGARSTEIRGKKNATSKNSSAGSSGNTDPIFVVVPHHYELPFTLCDHVRRFTGRYQRQFYRFLGCCLSVHYFSGECGVAGYARLVVWERSAVWPMTNRSSINGWMSLSG